MMAAVSVTRPEGHRRRQEPDRVDGGGRAQLGEINSEVSDQQGKLDEIKERYSDAEQSELDGISIDYDDWHFNVRPSNTEPLLRLNLESLVSREDMESKRDQMLDFIRS